MPKITRKAYIARTGHDQTHGNKIVAPEYGIIELRLKKDDTNKSKSYLPTTSTPPRKAEAGGKDEFCFAPGNQWKDDDNDWTEQKDKHDRVKIWYHLFNPFSVITEAKLQLFRRWDKVPLWERELKPEELLDGENELEFEYDKPGGGDKEKKKEWDGNLGAEDEKFPDGFVTAEHSPYKLRLVLTKGEGICQSPQAWTFFNVLVHEFKLVWGEKECIEVEPGTYPKIRTPFEELKKDFSDPEAGGLAKIYLNSDIFNVNGMDNNTLFDEYKNIWEKGPQIPLFAKVYIRNSAGTKVIAPKALGKTKFLWDWESKLQASSNTFAANAENYDKDASKPKGMNCHKDRGGKRGDDTNKVFPDQAGYDAADALTDGTFPFKVEEMKDNRKFAAFSLGWRKGKLAGKTGVLFRPSRMAGDIYKITLYSAHEITDDKRKPRLDVDTDAPLKIEASLKKETHEFEIWRRCHLIRYVKKTSSVTDMTIGNVFSYYEAAKLEIKDDKGSIQTYPASEWNSEVASVVNGWTANEQFAIDSTVNQHSKGGDGMYIRSRTKFREALMAGKSWTETKARNWMKNNSLGTDAKYADYFQDKGLELLTTVFDKKMRTDTEGCCIFQVKWTHNLMKSHFAGGGDLTDGMAADFPSGDLNHCGFLSTMDATAAGEVGYTAADVDITGAHEFGHHFMLPHPAPVNGESGYQAHDTSVNDCLMSYFNGPRSLCGFCQLRLRGWDKSKLLEGGGNNK